jgi:hypothetical protein
MQERQFQREQQLKEIEEKNIRLKEDRRYDK